VVSSSSPEFHRVGTDRTGQEAVIADEVRVFGRPAHEFSMACLEITALGGAPGKAAVIRFLRRKAGTTPEDFMKRFTGRHADLARPLVDAGKIVRYAQDSLVRWPSDDYAFDGISETWFASVDDAVRSFVDPKLTALTNDLSDFCDTSRGTTMLTEVIFRHPRE
jgi:hypothetical protein